MLARLREHIEKMQFKTVKSYSNFWGLKKVRAISVPCSIHFMFLPNVVTLHFSSEWKYIDFFSRKEVFCRTIFYGKKLVGLWKAISSGRSGTENLLEGSHFHSERVFFSYLFIATRDRCDFLLTDWRGGQLHEGRLGRQHPAQQEQEPGVVSERDHWFQHPEDGLVVTEQVFPERNVLLTLALKL